MSPRLGTIGRSASLTSLFLASDLGGDPGNTALGAPSESYGDHDAERDG